MVTGTLERVVITLVTLPSDRPLMSVWFACRISRGLPSRDLALLGHDRKEEAIVDGLTL